MQEFEAGRVIGSYRVVRRIGRGGMGTVYEVEHIALGVHYALKTFSFDVTRENADVLRAMFFEEGKVLARLQHPNLTHVFDLAVDEASGLPYFVMDLVLYKDGEPYTLEAVDTCDLDERHVRSWFADVASALDYIHNEGIVHRDIKLGNLLLKADGHVVVTDLGVSKIFDEHLLLGNVRQSLASAGDSDQSLMAGTRHYMAPEVIRGESSTPAADAYSLGVTMVKLLTGLWYDECPDALSRLSSCELRWNAALPLLLAPKPERRPLVLSTLVGRLDRPVVPKTVPARSSAPPPHAAGSLVVTILLCALGIVLAVVLVWMGLRNLGSESSQSAEPRQLEADLKEVR